MEQRTLRLPDNRVIYCYEDGSIEFFSKAHMHNSNPLRRTFGYDDGNGYRRIQIGDNHYKIHRLIALAFHPNLNNLPEVDHINRIRNDNRVQNLRWVTRIENANNKGRYRAGKPTTHSLVWQVPSSWRIAI